MSYLEKLAHTNWLEWRMFPVKDAEEPIKRMKSRLNITSIELDLLVVAIEDLANKYKGSNQDKALRTIAKKCWHYLIEQNTKSSIYKSFFPHQRLYSRCNRVYRGYHPQLVKNISVRCKDGVLEISEADFKILKRESPIFYSSQFSAFDELNIRAKTLEKLIAHLSEDELGLDDMQLVEYLDFVAAASLLKIGHLQRRYLINCGPLRNNPTLAENALQSKITELKSIDAKIFENKMLLEAFQNLIQYAMHATRSYSLINIPNLIPLKALKIGHGLDSSLCLYGPNFSNIANMISIEKLRFCSWGFTKYELIKLQSLKNLRELHFEYCRFSEDALEVLPQFSNLELLKIMVPFKAKGQAEFLSESLFKSIGQLSNLKELFFSRAGGIQDEWMKHLSSLKLETLKMNRISHFTGKGLRYLNQEALKTLKLEICCDLTKEGIQQIPAFDHLKVLVINPYSGSNKSSEGVDEEIINILPKLSLTTLKFAHREHVSPLSVYMQLKPEIEVISHWIEGTSSGLTGIPMRTVFKKAMQLKKWHIQSKYPSPIEIENALSRMTLTDLAIDLLARGILRLTAILNEFES